MMLWGGLVLAGFLAGFFLGYHFGVAKLVGILVDDSYLDERAVAMALYKWRKETKVRPVPAARIQKDSLKTVEKTLPERQQDATACLAVGEFLRTGSSEITKPDKPRLLGYRAATVLRSLGYNPQIVLKEEER